LPRPFLSQADGTLDAVLADEAVLQRMLEPISGGPGADKDDNVREALAEAISVLVSPPPRAAWARPRPLGFPAPSCHSRPGASCPRLPAPLPRPSCFASPCLHLLTPPPSRLRSAPVGC
jgi:hypothetical protein